MEHAKSMGIECAVIPFNTWMSERLYVGRPHHRIKQHWNYIRQARRRQNENSKQSMIVADCITSWQCNLICSNSSVIGMGYRVSKLTGVDHLWHIRELVQHHYKLYFDTGRSEFRKALKQATRIIAISDAVADYVRSVCGSRDINVIYDGVLRKQEISLKREQCTWPADGPLTVGMVGLIHPSKGQMEAVEAIAKLNVQHNVRLIIAGNGRDQDLKNRILELDLRNKVELLGYVSDPYSVYKQCHVVLMCSRYEGMGRTTMESMAVGRPVVGHNSGGTPELIDDGKNGFIYEDGVADLVECLTKFIEDPSLAKGMGKRAELKALEEFTIERYGDSVVRLLMELEDSSTL